MIADLKPYPNYKESGLAWLGQVPGHWELVPNRGLVRRRKVLVGQSHSDYRLLSLTKRGVIVRDISTGKGKFSSDMGTSQEVRCGDLVFCLFDVPETPRTVGLSPHQGMITGAYTVFEPHGSGNSEYFELFYRAMDDRKLLSPLYSGLRNTIPADRFLGTKTPQPPPDEQEAIVRFLDWANGRLERAIRAKRKVIALLNEQKQAIIHHAVTRGLDSSASLKPSGIPWLGDIPEHWEVRRARSCLLDTRAGTWGADPTPMNESDHVVCVRVADFDMQDLKVGTHKLTIRAVADSARMPRLLQHGDILMEKSGGGEAEPIGRVVLFDLMMPAVSSNFVIRLRADRSVVHPEFLLRVLAAMQKTRRNVPFIKQTTGIQNLNEKAYLSLGIGVPPLEEQSELLVALNEQVEPISAGCSRLMREIELLSEYRTRLVADVATGKLDVREAAMQLPDEPTPDTVEDDIDLVLDPEVADEEMAV